MLLALLAMAPAAGAKTTYKWHVETPGYLVDATKPLGIIGLPGIIGLDGAWELSAGRERAFAVMAFAGNRLFQRLRDEQETTQWIQCKIEDPPLDPRYDGALSHLVAITDLGDSLHVTSVLCSPIDYRESPAVPTVTVASAGMAWDRMKCEKPIETAWIAFVGFPRGTPGEIRDLIWKKGVLPCEHEKHGPPQ